MKAVVLDCNALWLEDDTQDGKVWEYSIVVKVSELQPWDIAGWPFGQQIIEQCIHCLFCSKNINAENTICETQSWSCRIYWITPSSDVKGMISIQAPFRIPININIRIIVIIIIISINPSHHYHTGRRAPGIMMDKTESCYSVISHKLGPNSRVYTILKMIIRSCVPHITTPKFLSMFDVYYFECRKKNMTKYA